MSAVNKAEAARFAEQAREEFAILCRRTAEAALDDLAEFHTVHDSSNAAYNWHVTILPGRFEAPEFAYGHWPVGQRGDAGANSRQAMQALSMRFNKAAEAFTYANLKVGFAVYNPIDAETETGAWWELTKGLYFWNYWKPLMEISQILEDATSAYKPGPYHVITRAGS